jgi:hypothetical protein
MLVASGQLTTGINKQGVLTVLILFPNKLPCVSSCKFCLSTWSEQVFGKFGDPTRS